VNERTFGLPSCLISAKKAINDRLQQTFESNRVVLGETWFSFLDLSGWAMDE
jgi:hypothetical protein